MYSSPFPAVSTLRSTPALRAAIALLLGLPIAAASAGTFTWNNTTGNWSDAAQWGGTAPTGANITDVLIFGGDVGTTVGVAPNYVATENLAGTPFVLNQLIFNATDVSGLGVDQTLVSAAGAKGLKLVANGATGAQMTQNGAGGITLDLPLELVDALTLDGNGTGEVTMNYAVTGAADIVKNGTSTFRFGTPFNSTTFPTTGPSANTWVGKLTINGGTIRFNNNAQAAPTALRSNPVALSAGAQLLFQSKETDDDSSARMGTLSGSGGLVQARGVLTGANQDSLDIGIYAFTDGDFAGTVRNTRVGTQSAGHKTGELVVRGTATQTFSGALEIEKDVSVGGSVTLKLAGTASLSAQTTGAIVLQGGTFTLDNAVINNNNRLREGSGTGMETIGGGAFSLIGNAAGTTETVSRLQLGSGSNARSGALTVNVTHNAGAAAATVLSFTSYTRDQAPNPANTVDFSARSGAGAVLALGQAGSNPRVTFIGAVPLFNGLLGNTGLGNTSTVGWATVNGTDFSTYGVNGVAAVPIDATPAASGSGSATSNVQITTSLALTDGGGYNLNSLKLAPTSAGQVLDLAGGNLRTAAILLAGSTDFSITATGGGGIENAGGTGPRYFHVQQAALTVGALLGVSTAPVVKAGDGTLVLTNPGNTSLTDALYINAGAVRATPGSSLPDGELRFRGGVLEITGGGTFARSIGFGSGNVTWSGIDGVFLANISEERGSGGFAAVGADASVDLNGGGASNLVWEDVGFIDSGFALILGSRNATAKVTFVDNLNLTQTAKTPIAPLKPAAPNYNAREIRVADNTAVTTDSARITGVISGATQNDLLKTGTGTLELKGTNTYSGNTIVAAGTLRVNGSIASSALTDVRPGAILSGNGAIGAVQVGAGAILAPGAAPGLTSALATKDLKFLGTSALVFEIGGVTTGGDGTAGYDQLNVTGTLSLNGGELQGTLLNGFDPTLGTLFFILKNDGSDAVSGTFAQGFSITISGRPFDLSYNGDSATNSFSTPGGNDVVVRAATPEPSSALLAASGLLGLGLRRRQRAAGKSQTHA